MKRLLFFTIILAATVQAQIIKPVQVTIFSTGATVTQDSLDAKLNRPEFDTLFGADSVYARALFARDTTYRKAQEAAIKALLVADTLYRAAQTALLKTAAYMDSLRVATLDKAQTVAGIQTFSGFNTFTGSNASTTTSSTNDSVQVTLSGVTASSIIIACYNTDVVTTTSLIPVSVGNVQTGKFTIYATNGKGLFYWIAKK